MDVEHGNCYICGRVAHATCHWCDRLPETPNIIGKWICEKHCSYVTPDDVNLPLSCCTKCKLFKSKSNPPPENVSGYYHNK